MKAFLLKVIVSSEEINKRGLVRNYYEYSSNYAHVIIAENEQDARQIAIDDDEPWYAFPDFTSCEEIDLSVSGIVLTQYAQG